MAQLPTGMTTTQMSFLPIIAIFVSYLVIHILIAVFYKKKMEEMDYVDRNDDEALKEMEGTVKILGFLHKWFPAIAIVLIVIGFYL